MFQQVIKGAISGCLTTISLTMLMPAAQAQDSICPPVSSDVSIRSQITPVVGSPVDLGQFSGVQVVILTSRGSKNVAQPMTQSLDIEFKYSKKLRLVTMVDGRSLSLFKGFILDDLKKLSSQSSAHTFLSADFDGNMVEPLIQAAEKLFPKVDLNKDAILLTLDSKGKVIAAYNNLKKDDLLVRQCLREQLKAPR
jgi:hypothetical protein